MNLLFKKILNNASLALVSLLTIYGIWAFAGMAMFVLLVATAPFTATFESLVLDYSIWALFTIVLLVPGIKLLYSVHNEIGFSLWRVLRGYWFYLVPAYGVLLATVFLINSTLGYQLVVLVELSASIWYFLNFKKCVLKK